ncbi:MAG: hypothetical protein E7627_06905 [Ruminococcaceae bacterium]|nr:hypothetical protein [Oscillospiraceae bacterium]
MKRYFLLILSVLICISCFVSCGDTSTQAPEEPPEIRILPGQDVSVLSMNLLTCVPDDVTRSLDGRDAVMPGLLLSYDVDSIGVQESYGWVEILDEKLVGYGRTGYCANGSTESYPWCAGNYIYYKEDKYKVIDSGIIWLNDTPDLIEDYAQNCSWAILENKETGFRYVHMNVHLIADDRQINAQQMPIMRDAMARFIKLGFPVFTTGDFNASQGSENYLIMMKEESLHDSKLIAKESMNMGTYHGMSTRDLTGHNPIDYCFVSHEVMEVNKYEVVDTCVNGKFATDHNGVYVHATVDSLPDQYALTPELSTDGITISVNQVRPYVAELTITQATDCFHVNSYMITATDENGNIVESRYLPSRNTHKNIPKELYFTLSGLSPETKYAVRVYPASVIGTVDDYVEIELVTPALD